MTLAVAIPTRVPVTYLLYDLQPDNADGQSSLPPPGLGNHLNGPDFTGFCIEKHREVLHQVLTKKLVVRQNLRQQSEQARKEQLNRPEACMEHVAKIKDIFVTFFLLTFTFYRCIGIQLFHHYMYTFLYNPHNNITA